MKDFQASYNVLLFDKTLAYDNFLQYNSGHLSIFLHFTRKSSFFPYYLKIKEMSDIEIL